MLGTYDDDLWKLKQEFWLLPNEKLKKCNFVIIMDSCTNLLLLCVYYVEIYIDALKFFFFCPGN